MASTQAADRIASASGALVDADRVLVIAHRGDSADYPENTLPAFESAVKCGADLVELDYHHTADGVPVVLHDATLDRTTNARDRFGIKGILVSHRRLSDLAGLDAGLWKGEQFSGAHLPTLAEAIDTIQTGSMTLIERKAGDAKTCVDYLKAKNLLDKVVVQAFDWNYVADCHELAPELTLAALGGKEITGKRLDAVVATGARIAAWHQDSLSRESIGRIHNRGLRAWAFTVDDPRRIQELLDAGIDGIISNKPGLVREIIAERADHLVPASR
jgi:glycerophosphoryl diester phosphodiesterase